MASSSETAFLFMKRVVVFDLLYCRFMNRQVVLRTLADFKYFLLKQLQEGRIDIRCYKLPKILIKNTSQMYWQTRESWKKLDEGSERGV